jgi:predicted DNA-binding transcriptional regulator AlpA
LGKVEIIGWLAGLPDDDPSLAKINAIRRGDKPDPEEALLSLKDMAKVLGYRDSTTLHKLQIQKAGISLGGGRLRYRRSNVEEYLRSPECMAIRAELRRVRREHEETTNRKTAHK